MNIPFSVEMNAVFVVDLNKLTSPNDVLCDDMGVWTWGVVRGGSPLMVSSLY